MRRLSLLLLGATLAFGDEPGFVSIFNGKNLDGWTLVRGRGPGYIVEDGKIVCPADGGGNLFTEKEYANFVLRFEFKFVEGSNNGVGIRSPLTGDAAYAGMEIQLLDDGAPRYKGLKPAQFHGSIYDLFPAKQCCRKPVGEWNEQEITANGPLITVTLNGSKITEGDLSTITDPAVLKKHPGVLRTSGHIGFLGHGTRVEFRNVRVKELK